MRTRAILLSALLVVSMVGMATAPAAATTQEAEGEAYAGTNIQFDQKSNAVANYSVNQNVIVENVTMQSSSEARGQAGIGLDAGLGAATDIVGANIDARTEARASVSLGFESGGEMTAHDNNRGVVTFDANGEDQVVNVGVSSDAEAEAESDNQVVVEKDDGSQGVFIAVGDGEVVVNDEGNVTAEIEGDGQLVYRQHESERSDDDEEAERMIADGTATAEVYVQGAADEGEETAVEAIEYGQDTAVEVLTESRSNVELAVERTESQGKVVLTSVSEEAFDSAEDIEVFVDGEAATRADSYSEVEQSAMDGDEPRFYVAQSASAEAAVDVAIGIDHFSERNVQMTSDDDADEDASTPADDEETPTEADEDDDADATDGDGAGFGALAALAALASALIAVRRY